MRVSSLEILAAVVTPASGCGVSDSEPRSAAASARSIRSAPSRASASCKSPAVMSGAIATRSAIAKFLTMAPVSSHSSICMMVTPLAASPAMMARLIGAAPINRAIMAGDAASGVTIMQMDEWLDTGAIVRNFAMAERVAIAPDMTAGDLHDALARLGADLMLRALAAAERGSLSLTPQPEAGVTPAAKISKDQTRIEWTKPWRYVQNHIRRLSPYPGAWC